MNIEITWTITAVIAVSSLLSPVLVTLLNNRHQTRIRRMDLEHQEKLRLLELQQHISEKQFDIYYTDKKQAFGDFLHAAGTYSLGKNSSHSYENLQATLHKALLFCNQKSETLLLDFLEYADNIFGGNYSQFEREQYSKTLASLSKALNDDLSLAKPTINCEKCK